MSNELAEILRSKGWWKDPLLLHKAKRLMIREGYPAERRVFIAEVNGCPTWKQFYSFFAKE